MQQPGSQDQRVLTHHGAQVPRFFYGTAWKEDQTESLTEQALRAGFRAIDTANQRRHYFEAGVGKAVQKLLAEGALKRNDLFLQTKFTHRTGQDHRLPYDPKAPLAEQVNQSVQSSLQHLGVTYLDAYLLHGPTYTRGLTDGDWQVWRTMEGLQQSEILKFIGVSNVSADQLGELLRGAKVKPAFVQNRCYAQTGWDARVRSLCREQGLVYQGFSLLTANGHAVNRPQVHEMARRLKATLAQVVFAFALQVGMIPLTGTTDPLHMQADLEALNLILAEEELQTLERIALPGTP